MKQIYTLLLLFFFTGLIHAQTVSEKVIRKTDTLALHRLASDAGKSFQLQQDAANQKARMKGWSQRVELPEGGVREIVGLEPDGKPLLFGTSNLNAAKTVSTNKVWPGGSAGLNLTGSGLTIAIWDGGKVRATHQEFGGRAVQSDAATVLNNHSTHVAGTMIAAGVDANAKGMAYQANLNARDWNFDVMEMANAAAAGLLISNHSYKHISGWEGQYWYGDTAASRVKDNKFGLYEASTRQYDLVCNYAPYYLPVVAASNDRLNTSTYSGKPNTGYYWNGTAWAYSSTARPPDGPYDCIPTFCTAKNILTVGNVADIAAGYSVPANVVLVSSSSCGPTDDGRIKPDIVANGSGLYSSYSGNDAAYASISGTSMATPNTSGSLLLLQQHYHNLYNDYLRSSTIKAIVINTADEAGAANGPDYQFGWGLLNTKKAADVITNKDSLSLIEELNISQGQTFTMEFYCDGSSPVKAALAWNDPAAASSEWVNDPSTLRLINNLNMVITKTASSWSPYILDPANPAGMATTGNNFRDNVERIDIAAPTAGTYTLTITHSGTLVGGSQDFSLVVTGVQNKAPKEFQVTSVSFDQLDISWNLNQAYPVLLAYSTDGVFGNPLNNVTYISGNSIPGGGTVIYSGSGTTFNHTGLIPATMYYYKIWSLINVNPDYSSGLPANGITQCQTMELPYSQTFNNILTPDCWQILKQGNAEGWSISNSNYCDGSPKELYHSWEDLYNNSSSGIPNATSRAVLPAVNTTGKSSLTLLFRQYYKDPTWSSSGTATIKIQSSPDGISWTDEGWSHVSHTGDIGPEIKSVTITHNLNLPKTYIAFTITGDLYDFWYWSVDDVQLSETSAAPKILSIKVLPEGLWNGSNLNKAQGNGSSEYSGNIADQITFELHDASNYSTVVYSLDSINLPQSGTALFTVPASYSGSYYIAVRHRNSIETVSSSPVSFAGTMISYNFTTADSQAFGSNLQFLNTGIYGVFSGDSNGDGAVDGLDMIEIDNDAAGFNSGYLVTDLNGDGAVDALDLIMVDNNATNFISRITPP